jgi:hypothetical protein
VRLAAQQHAMNDGRTATDGICYGKGRGIYRTSEQAESVPATALTPAVDSSLASVGPADPWFLGNDSVGGGGLNDRRDGVHTLSLHQAHAHLHIVRNTNYNESEHSRGSSW